jgi:CRP/FNR family transcriptional regulator
MRAIQSNAEERARQLRKAAIFSELDRPDLKSLGSATRLREYEADETLFREGEPAEAFHVIVKGQVKICRFNPEGREQILEMFGPGEPCGEVPVFQGSLYPATAIAVSAAQTLYLPRDKFLALSRKRPGVLLKMLSVLSKRLRRFVQLVDDLALKEVSARLARYILDLSEQQEGAMQVSLDTAKGVLASRLGTIAETLSRTLARMQQKRLIGVQGRKITILDPDGLEDLAAGVKL